MLIDWVTVAAQIVNFLILVGLLKKFLYAPIIRSMDEREAKIADRLDDARRSKETAQQEAEEYREKNEELDDKRAEMMQEAKTEAEQLRKELVQQARSEVEEKKQAWLETTAREQDAFLSDLRIRAGEKILAISRQALADLANRQMERQVVEVFLEALEGADPAELGDSGRFENKNERGVTVSSAFELQDDLRDRLMQKIREWIGQPVRVDFAVSRELLSGIELKSNGRKVVWNLKDYLDSLEQSMRNILQEEREGGSGAADNPERQKESSN